MVQGAFVFACGPKALELGPSGRLRRSTRDVESLARASFIEDTQVFKSPGGCLVSAGQPSVLSSAKTSSLLAVVVGSVTNYGYLVNKYLLSELSERRGLSQSAFTLNDISKAEPASVATLVAFLFATLGPAELLRKLRGFFVLVVYDPSKAWVFAARSPGARATVIQARGPDGSLVLASHPSYLPPGSHALQELQPGCFKLGWHSGPRCFSPPSAPASASLAGAASNKASAQSTAPVAAAPPPEKGGVKKTKRGKRGGKKHAAEAEQKSLQRQCHLPARHSLDSLLSTAASSGCRLSSLRHMLISERLPTPKAATSAADGPWRSSNLPASSATYPHASLPPCFRDSTAPRALHQLVSSFTPSCRSAAAVGAESQEGGGMDAATLQTAGTPMDVDESSAAAQPAAAGSAMQEAGGSLAEPTRENMGVLARQAADQAGAPLTLAECTGSTSNSIPYQAVSPPKVLGLLAASASASAQPVHAVAPVPRSKQHESSLQSIADVAAVEWAVESNGSGPAAADSLPGPSGGDLSTPLTSLGEAKSVLKPTLQVTHAPDSTQSSSTTCVPESLPPSEQPRQASAQPPLTPIQAAARTDSGSGESLQSLGSAGIPQLPRIRTDSSNSLSLAAHRSAANCFDDAENSPPPQGPSPNSRAPPQLTVSLLSRMTSKASLQKSDSGLSLTSNSSQGSAGQSPTSSRRSPLGLLHHLAHATIRRGFASHSTPNLAAMGEDAAGADSSEPHMHAVPEWVRHTTYEPLMEPVREDASEGPTTPLDDEPARNTWGCPWAESPLLRRSPRFPVGWKGIGLPASRPVAGSPGGSGHGMSNAGSHPPTAAAAAAGPGGMGDRVSSAGDGDITAGQGSGALPQARHSDDAGDEAWEALWKATPWDAALVGMTAMRQGPAHRHKSEHPVGVGGWEQGTRILPQQAQQQSQRTTHRATITGGLPLQLQPGLRTSQMKSMSRSKSCNDLELVGGNLGSRGALRAFA